MHQHHRPHSNRIISVLIDTGREWMSDKVSSLGAALAFYSLLSLGPLLLIIISIAGLAFGQEAASGHIFGQLRGLIGDEGAAAIQAILANSRNKNDSLLATIIGVVTLLIAVTGVFGQLQDSLNTIWKVKAKPTRTVWSIVRVRFLSFSLVVGIGFLMLISLVVSAGLSAFAGYFADIVPPGVLYLLDISVSFSIITVLFAMIFKILPDVHIRWRDVWFGAAITALLFTLGKNLIGLYLGQSALSTTYGAAGSLIVVLIWIYYSNQILFLGAEFTQVYVRYFGTQKQAARGAVPSSSEVVRNKTGNSCA